MTLVLTVTTPRCIYQSADYRLTDLTTGEAHDFGTQKIFLVNTFTWSATVAFAGVGRTTKLDVSEWLAERVGSIGYHDTFDRLMDELLTADTWLSEIPPPNNRHSFSIGAFIESEPVFVLMSNFEHPSGLISRNPSRTLTAFRLQPKKLKTFVSAQQWAVARPWRRRLEVLAGQDPPAPRMFSAMTEFNRAVALKCPLVSPSCFTTYLRLTGEGGGAVQDQNGDASMPLYTFPKWQRDAIAPVLNQHFGAGRARVKQVMLVRENPSDKHFELQLREKPNDPNVHSNYGVWLKEKKNDPEGAERAYRKALELDPNHVNALTNLANLLWEKRDIKGAEEFYKKALAIDPGNENASWNYGRFLCYELHDPKRAREIVEEGITRHRDNARRLTVLKADVCLYDRAVIEALECYRSAREQGAQPAQIEPGYATALHASGEPIGECIAAYRVAISVCPQTPHLRLNLAQLLFVNGEHLEAKKQLGEAMKLGLDDSAQLEAQFYLLCHTEAESEPVFRLTRSLLERGAQLNWDVQANIQIVEKSDKRRAELLSLVSLVMEGKREPAFLDELLARWQHQK
jgi:tetratricopeptide (TPR) repeat protein